MGQSSEGAIIVHERLSLIDNNEQCLAVIYGEKYFYILIIKLTILKRV